MKLIKIQYIALLIIIIIAAIFVNQWGPLVEGIITVLFIYWCFLLLIYMLFSYSTRKKNYTIGQDGKRKMKQPGGLQVHGVTFEDFLRYILHNRIAKKEDKKESINGLKEKYPNQTKAKEIVLLLFTSMLYIFVAVNADISILWIALIILLGCPALLIFVDLLIIRARYEECIFETPAKPEEKTE
ncbi:MAG: hypothetical protein JXN65_10175 [Clostridia bacterium]|nr:hypothetical protein [Clostridia bacterium]